MAILNVGGGLSSAVKKPVAKFNVDTGKKVLPTTTRQTTYYTAPTKPTAKPVPVYNRASTPATINLGGSSVSPATTALAQAAAVSAPAAPSFQDLTKQYLDDSRSEVNKLYDMQKDSRLQALKAQRDAAIGKINTQKQGTRQDFYNQRNQADVVNAQNVARLREIMAANGINASGENLTTQAQANSDRLNSLNALNQQEQQQLNAYDNQISEINNPAEENAIISQIESERSKAILDAQNTAVERAWRSHTFNNMSASEKATLEWAKQQYGEDAAWKMFELQYNGNMQQSMNDAQIAASTGFTSKVEGGDNASKVWNFLSGKGLTPNQVAGIMGNLQLESGLNSNATNKSSGAFGIAQWLGGRKTALQNYARSVGASPNDLTTQLNFLWSELNGSEKKTLNYLSSNRNANASQVAAMFDKLFERSEGTHIPQRQSYANQFFNSYGRG